MLEQYAQELSKESGKRYGFTIPIDAILAIAMVIIESCIKTPEDFIRAAKTPTKTERAVVRFFVIRELDVHGKKSGKITDDLFTYMGDKSDDELAGMYLAQQAAIGKFAVVDDDELDTQLEVK